MNKKYHIGIRHTDPKLHFKLHYVAKYEGRSVNGHIMYLIRKSIAEFEANNGVIEIPDKE